MTKTVSYSPILDEKSASVNSNTSCSPAKQDEIKRVDIKAVNIMIVNIKLIIKAFSN